MCYSCRDFVNDDSSETFEYYNININEYEQLSSQVFADVTNSNLSNEPLKKEA